MTEKYRQGRAERRERRARRGNPDATSQTSEASSSPQFAYSESPASLRQVLDKMPTPRDLDSVFALFLAVEGVAMEDGRSTYEESRDRLIAVFTAPENRLEEYNSPLLTSRLFLSMLILVQKYLKDKRVLIAAAVAVLALVLIVGGVFMMLRGSNNAASDQQTASPTEVPVLALQPADIGLTLTAASNMQTATMTITKTGDITSVDYQLSYNAEVSGQSIPRGTIGHADVKTPGQTITQKMVFGTCSDVCHYDTGITEIKLIVKVTKTDGKVYQVEQSLATQ
jgi:hypothetical protein